MHTVRFGAVQVLREYNPQDYTFVIQADNKKDLVQRIYSGEAALDSFIPAATLDEMVNKPVEFSVSPLNRIYKPAAPSEINESMAIRLRWNDDGAAQFTDQSKTTYFDVDGPYDWTTLRNVIERYPLSADSQKSIVNTLFKSLRETVEKKLKSSKARFEWALNAMQTTQSLYADWLESQLHAKK